MTLPDTVEQRSPFLTVPELARLLHINEKKVYQLAGDGEIPGTKITGKWIFPRKLVEDWIMQNSHGGVLADRLIIAGSDDALLAEICSDTAIDMQQSALLSYCPCGTRHGLRMLDSRRADACFINWGPSEVNARRHIGLLRGYANHADWLIVRCLQRTQGLILPAHTAAQYERWQDLLVDARLRWALRSDDSGCGRLLQDLCGMQSLRDGPFANGVLCNSAKATVTAVSTGNADVTLGAQSTAHAHQLAFMPITDVSLDLVVSRRTYFRSLLQQLLKRLVDNQAAELAAFLKGYTLLPELEVVSVS